MIYYQVPKVLDGKAIKVLHKKRLYTHCLVAYELYTKKECEKLCIPLEKLCKVDISRKNIYWFFGARFIGIAPSKIKVVDYLESR